MFKILGTDDAVNTCDCCGKTNLKATVVVEVNGEILHYGSVCATRHTGLNSKEIKAAIKTEVDGRKMAAQKAYRNSPECVALQICINQAHRQGLKPGREFGDFTREASAAANEAARRIATEYNLEPWQVQ